MHTRTLLPLLLLAACHRGSKDTAGPADTAPQGPPEWRLGEVVDTEGPGVLARLDAPWGGPLWLVRVEGSHYDMGYQYGRLVGPMLWDLWWTYMESMADEVGLTAELVDQSLGYYMDLAWEKMGPNTPQDFLEEFQGVADGMAAAGVEADAETLEAMPHRLVLLLDLAMSSQLDASDLGTFQDFVETGYSQALLDYYQGRSEPVPPAHNPLFNCSFFAAWGERTEGGGLYATRNMDFTADTGIWTQAMIAAFVPEDGVPYATISWTGATLGALAGISQEGITISAVGSSSPYERLATEPQVLKGRELLEHATSLDDAIAYMDNSLGDGICRAPTIGYNALVTWGDPRGGGAGAEAAILEANGLEIGAYRHRSDCSVEPSLVRFDYDGALASTWTPDDHPEWVNAEADAQEIDGEGHVRTFAVDENGDYVLDESGNYVEDPDGQPIQTGYPEPCALYRGDEAMMYGVRVFQTAANGPAEGGTGLMIQSGSWRHRYWPMRQMTRAYASGTALELDGEEVVPDNGGVPVPIGMDQAEAISRVAAMSSNVWDVIYDATGLRIRVSYESGTGDDWVRAADQPSFLEIDLDDLFLTD